MLSGSWDTSLKLWDATTGQLIGTFEGHSDQVTSVTFSPNGNRLLSGSYDKSLKLWDPATGHLIRIFEGHMGPVWSVAFSRDGLRIASGGDGTTRIWDGRIAATPPSDDGWLLATLNAGRGGNDEWLTITPKGFFAAGRRGNEMLAIIRGLEVTSVTQVFHHLYRPDLVEELLKGDPERKHKNEAFKLQSAEDHGLRAGPSIAAARTSSWSRRCPSIRAARTRSRSSPTMGKAYWRAHPCEIDAAKMMLILDTCEAGASEFFRGNDREREAMMGQLEAATGLNIIGAAPQGKAAYEGYKGHGVLTYALLEAMHKPEGSGAEPVDVFGLAGHVGRQVPVISQRQFAIRQKPETKLRDNFPLGFRQAVLKEAEPEAKPAAVLRPVQVRVAAADDAPVKETLGRGAQVKIKRTDGAWSLIEQNGVEIGFVPSDALLELERN